MSTKGNLNKSGVDDMQSIVWKSYSKSTAVGALDVTHFSPQKMTLGIVSSWPPIHLEIRC